MSTSDFRCPPSSCLRMGNRDCPYGHARNHNRGNGNVTRRRCLFVHLSSPNPPVSLTLIRSTFPIKPDRDGERSSEVISFLKRGGGCSRRMRNVKRDGLWWLLTCAAGLSAMIIPVVMNYFCADAEGMIIMLFLGTSSQTDYGGGSSLRVNKTGLWPKGCLFESEG